MLYVITLPRVNENGVREWRSGICTCPAFLKDYICKHLVGLALRLKYERAPEAAKNVPLGKKRAPGRPKKALKKGALLVN